MAKSLGLILDPGSFLQELARSFPCFFLTQFICNICDNIRLFKLLTAFVEFVLNIK